jgi:glycosyltransferase involved in cell wall biosynthesis
MKVVMVVSNPFTNDPRVYAEVESLIRAGYGVTVVAYDGERRHPVNEYKDNIEIERVRSLLPPMKSLRVPKLWLQIWKGINLLVAQWLMYRRAVKLHKIDKFSVVHCHDLDTLTIGVALRRKFKIALIYDAHEIYSYLVSRVAPRLVAKAFSWLEKLLVKRADWIITVSEPVERYLSRKTKKPISIIMNCKELRSSEYQPTGNPIFTILYIGSLHAGRAVPMLVEALKEIPHVQCIIGGIGQPDYVRMLEEQCKSTTNVKFIGEVPFKDVLPMTGKADAVFLMANPRDRNNRIGLGNKQFEAMVCGRPIICTKGTYSGEVTEREEVGLTVDYNKEALRAAIIRLKDDFALRERLGRNALQAAITKYNWPKQEEKLLDIYKKLTRANTINEQSK